MASGTKKKSAPKRDAVKAARGSVVTKKQVPWATIAVVTAIVLLAGFVFGYYYVASSDKRAQEDREEAAAAFKPSQQNPDPSKQIKGVVIKKYEAGAHVQRNQKVAYNQSPPFGGPHDWSWATCNGNVYSKPVRSENMVHALEHGAVWIAYDPKQVRGESLAQLKLRVDGKPFMLMSPYPGLDRPISLQSWGHQLKVDSATDQRIDQFITALRRNPTTYPEVGATCDQTDPTTLQPGSPPPFDPANPPPFDATPGKKAVPMDYKGAQGVPDSMGGGQQPQSPAEG